MGEARGTCATEKMFTEFGGSPEGQGPLKNTFAQTGVYVGHKEDGRTKR